MPYLHIEDFRAGLDTRKSLYTAPPGSLRVLKNAHITRGAEIEKRKAFAEYVDLTPVLGQTHGLHASRGRLWVFGSYTALTTPGAIGYIQLPTGYGGTHVTKILKAVNFGADIYVIADYADGVVRHFLVESGANNPQGWAISPVTEWQSLATDATDSFAVLNYLARQVRGLTGFQAEPSSNKLFITGPVGVDYTITAEAVNQSGGVDDQVFFLSVLQSAQAEVTEAAATAEIEVTGGQYDPGVTLLNALEVDGAPLISSPVNWYASNETTAQRIADAVNEGAHGYTASSAGALVTLYAPDGAGASVNGAVVTPTTAGGMQVVVNSNFAGGVDYEAALPKIVEIWRFGTLEFNDIYTVTIDGVNSFHATAFSAGYARSALVYKNKVYAPANGILYFSGFTGTPPVPNAEAWLDTHDGAGYIDLRTQDGGSTALEGLGVYQDQLAVFAARAIYLWRTDPDPAQNVLVQTLQGIGTESPGSIQAYGDIDLFFLSDSGVRSLRARDSSNLAASQDVGTPIDEELVAYARTLTEAQRRSAKSVVEPYSGRYWLSIGERIYVFSHFPGSRVTAWSTYEPGFEVEELVTLNNRVYARAGETIYLYGGRTGDEYDDSEVEVTLPFLDASNPANAKMLSGLDIGMEGQWTVEVGLDPSNPEYYERVGSFNRSSYGQYPRIPLTGRTTHFSLKLTHNTAEYARLGNLAIHYKDGVSS